jgi:hypothetical protein
MSCQYHIRIREKNEKHVEDSALLRYVSPKVIIYLCFICFDDNNILSALYVHVKILLL